MQSKDTASHHTHILAHFLFDAQHAHASVDFQKMDLLRGFFISWIERRMEMDTHAG